MSDHKQESHIADDWLEVDDAASVMSLSSFDDTTISQPTSPLLKPSHSPDLEHSLRPKESSPVAPPSPEPKLLLEDPSVTHKLPHLIDAPTASSAGKDAANDADALTPPPSTTSIAIITRTNPDFADPWTVEQENIRDPRFYHKTLCAAIESIEATAKKALELGASRISTLSFLKSTCDELAKHAKELEPILGGYAQRWNEAGPHADAQDIPLNPSLLDWIAHLRMQLVNSQVEMNRIDISADNDERPRALRANSIPLHVNVALAGCAEALEDALTTIEDFMPIFKTDFDETLTRGMDIPSKEIGQAKSAPRREPPHPNVARLRRELYSLKDQLRRINAFLSFVCTPGASDALPEVPHTIACLERVIESITIILTNHASEWFESSLGTESEKVISYQAFLALESDLLHDLTGRLEQIHDDLVMDEGDWKANCEVELIRNHQIVLLTEGGMLKEIISTAELLESLVFPDN